MKTLTLDDLSREELLTWIKRVGLFSVRQVDLLEVRHATLSAKKIAATEKWDAAETASIRALQAVLACKDNGRERNRLDRIYLDMKDTADRARKASEKARREEEVGWATLEAEWERGR